MIPSVEYLLRKLTRAYPSETRTIKNKLIHHFESFMSDKILNYTDYRYIPNYENILLRLRIIIIAWPHWRFNQFWITDWIFRVVKLLFKLHSVKWHHHAMMGVVLSIINYSILKLKSTKCNMHCCNTLCKYNNYIIFYYYILILIHFYG